MSNLISQLDLTAKYKCLFLIFATAGTLRTNPRGRRIYRGRFLSHRERNANDEQGLAALLLATHVLYPFSHSIIVSMLSPIIRYTGFTDRDGEIVENVGDYDAIGFGGGF